MKKHIIPVLLCLVMVMSVLMLLPAEANAATAQETGNEILAAALAMEGNFPEDGSDYNAKCPACNKDVTWKALKVKYTSTGEANAHFYLASDTNYTSQFIEVAKAQGTFCLHTNGHTNTGTRRFINAKSGTVVNIMGSGTLKGNPQEYRATILANSGGTINIYGTTIESTATKNSIYDDAAICTYNASATINVWGGKLVSGVTPVISSNGTVNLYNSTATGAAAKVSGHGDVTSTSAKLNIVDSSVTGVVVNAGSVTVSGAAVISGSGLQLPAGMRIDPTGLTDGASIAVASEGAFTASGMTDYAKYFTSANSELTFTAKTDGTLANLDKQAYGQVIIEKAEALEGKFPTSGTYDAVCPVCDVMVTWKPMTAALTTNYAAGDHYYFPKNASITSQALQMSSAKDLCLHTNGYNRSGNSRFCIATGGSTLNIMGSGTISATASNTSTGGTLYVNGGTVNVFGTTIESTYSGTEKDFSALCLYNATATANVWSSELKAGSNPVVNGAGTMNLYNCIGTGEAAVVGAYATQSGTSAELNLFDTTLPGVNLTHGSMRVSGATRITGTGLSLAAGKTINPSKLTEGASIAIASEGAFTAAGMANYAKYFTTANPEHEITVSSTGVLRCWKPGALLIDADGVETVSDSILTDWATGNYSYIKLYGDDQLAMSGENIVVDLAGFDLIASGAGSISAFDTANDTYDSNACGAITADNTITIAESVVAPNGNRYIAVNNNGRVTAHRLSISINAVSLRTTSAGLYYKAKYTCDRVLSDAVQTFGVVLSVNNMPGADFMTEEKEGNYNVWSVCRSAFESGVVATSGSVFGIMKETRTAAANDQYGKMPIYVNAYIDLGNGPVVADLDNAGLQKTDENFSGVALSLYDVMFMLDDAYHNYNATTRMQLDNFYFQWEQKGMDWNFVNIGQTAGIEDGVDNSDLVFDEGTTNAVCPVCEEKVTWTAFQPSEASQGLTGHYYLTDDVTFEGKDASGIVYNGTKNTTLCLHLNGHNMTAGKTRAIFGSSGVINVMGNGIVTGYNNAASGAAVQTNNTVAGNGVYLYGGTYRRASGTSDKAAAIGTNNCGYICVYRGATIDAPGAKAVLQSVPAFARGSYVGLFGCTVNGDVVTMGANVEKGFDSTTELVDCTVNGNVQVSQSTVYLSGAPKIESVTLADGALLNTKVLTQGASIGIATEGIFTAKSESVTGYIDYFHGTVASYVITVRDYALHCGPDYTGDLKFAEGTADAMCPACGEVVTWTVADGTAKLSMQNGDHYYLADDVTFTGASGDLAFLSAPGTDKTACFHLNGHNITATNTRMIYGSAGVLNVMGTGVASGLRNDRYTYGGVVQINTAASAGRVNLYGGTWKHLEGGTYSETDYVLSISVNGGGINVFEGATVEANSNGNAVYIGGCGMADSNFGVYGGTVKGKVYALGANQEKGHVSYVTVDNANVDGTLDINGVNTVTVSHAAKIQLLDMEETSLLTLGAMTQGANITVLNEGVFTQPSDDAQDYLAYFKPANEYDLIVVQENALRYRVNYTSNVYPNADGKAYCPVCKEVVEWTPVSSGASSLTAEAGKHYYLTADILYEGAYDTNGAVSFLYGGKNKNTASCFHLNGHNITATKAHGIFGGYGVLNIMGEGIVTGHAVSVRYGGAAHVNNSVVGNTLNLYSGTYKNAATSVAGSGAVAVAIVGGKISIYEDAKVYNPDDIAIYLNASRLRDTALELHGATVQGGISTLSPENETYGTTVIAEDATITGEVNIAAGVEASFDGRIKIGKLTVAQGVIVDITNMLEGSAITVSADGVFTSYMALADEWLSYITCADEGDWIIVRDKTFYQGVKQEITVAADDDKTALNTTYSGKTVKYGEMHDHTNATERADGNNSLAEWKAEMDRLEMDFATIVDHGQSQHMYHADWDESYFVGGSEPGTTITDSKASPRSPHYNMVFSDKEKLEALVLQWEKKTGKTDKSKFVIYRDEESNDKFTEGLGGFLFSYPTYTTAEFAQLAKDIYDAGGLFVQVHPKYDSYIYSNDPMDYYFADYTGLEITTGSGGNMMFKDNNEAYETWVDLLEMGKKIWATSGSDKHRYPNLTALTTMYTDADHCDTYIEHMRAGNFAPGWIGIRMNVNGTAMGGETAFAGNRLQFSVGDIYNTGVTDKYNTAPAYVEGHVYRVELYDDGGILMSSAIDPTQMNYFAIDCDATAKYYRVVVWDETDNERIGVGNPIWNTAAE